jgi:hypothetical protein
MAATTAAVVGAGTALYGAQSQRKAQKAQRNAMAEGREVSQARVDDAKKAVSQLFPKAIAAGREGYNAAFDLTKLGGQQSLGAYSAGNLAAQNTLKSGAKQFRNALLGDTINYDMLPSMAPQYDLSAITNAQSMQGNDLEGDLALTNPSNNTNLSSLYTGWYY